MDYNHNKKDEESKVEEERGTNRILKKLSGCAQERY